MHEPAGRHAVHRRIGVPPRRGQLGPPRRSRSPAGRIAAVGPDDELAALAGPDTDVVDLAGGLLLPGFQDAHVHPVMGGLAMLQCDLHGTTSAQECLDIVADVRRGATPTSSGSSAAAGRWSSSRAAPRRVRPSTRSSPTGRSSSPTATATAPGSTPRRSSSPASTRRPRTRADGRIEREADGYPTGTLHEGAGEPGRPAAARHQRRRHVRRPAGRAGAAVLARHHGLAGRRRRARCSASTTSTRST